MMIKQLHKLFFAALFLTVGLSSCKEEEIGEAEDIPGLGGDEWVQGPIDKWILDSLVTPYNISAKYKWDQFEFGNITKTLVPPDESQVVPLLSTIKKAWTMPYVQEAGKVFYNKFSPKFFILSGSNEYNAEGSVTLGTAEGGRKVVLFGVNLFKIKGMAGYDAARDSSFVKDWFLHTIHHEFGHILHQTVLYPVEYKAVSRSLYQGGNWINWSDNDARRDGFITAYSSLNFDEDFVEMIAMMLTEGKAGFDKIVNAIPEGTSPRGTTKAQAQAALRQKEAIVVAYYKNTWKIDFYSLQNRVRGSMNKLF
ncbi:MULTISPECIES: putative zinc-binding metallopeptidase [Dyadobacter]|uniref:Zinc-binding metallopeptidase n=1 Tax=Dyadobacter chenhuakuii TaxID=2909339 RepID=A0ABY4XFR4_9BACT|nr:MULTISPECIES: putative zinc-binding metallopeptidase [Dyadobacter]MCF2491991.1 putative zinc-binding metallopeptidase [Dyadobacter chenhuakuii]MCF2516628.1 putative zinc-binding metallopeptidase [Dyadobacter sp. CY351]USJ28848.1 putative zinc-binding metallopeptidase [Dyadobacter chenhuakuii]